MLRVEGLDRLVSLARCSFFMSFLHRDFLSHFGRRKSAKLSCQAQRQVFTDLERLVAEHIGC
jgi:hypothetical protein